MSAAYGGVTLRVAAYNVLAQCLAKSAYFAYVTGDTLKWKARLPRLLGVLEGLRADVLCLSEVDQIDAYDKWFSANGYAYAYQHRRGKQYGNLVAWRRERFRLLRSAACDMNDLAVLMESPLAYPNSSAWASYWLGPTLDPTRIVAASDYRRHAVAVFVALQSVEAPQQTVVAGSTHLYFDPAFPHVRAAQAAMLHMCLTEFAHAAAGAAGIGADSIPVFMGGDYNSNPGTPGYDILTHVPFRPDTAFRAPASLQWDAYGKDIVIAPPESPSVQSAVAATPSDNTPGVAAAVLPAATPAAALATPAPAADAIPEARRTWLPQLGAYLEYVRKQYEAGVAALDVQPGSLVHTGRLRSAYAAAAGVGMPVGARVLAEEGTTAHSSVVLGEPAFTTYTKDFRGALDYIFFADGAVPAASTCGTHVTLQHVLPLPSEADILADNAVAMPSQRHPSDHAPIAADFAIAGSPGTCPAAKPPMPV